MGVGAPLRIGRGQERVADKDRVGAGHKTQGLQFFAHLISAGGKSHHRLRADDPRHGDGTDKFDTRNAAVCPDLITQRRTHNGDQIIDRDRIRMMRQDGQLVQKRHPVRARLAHAHNATAAGLHPHIGHGLQRIQTFLISARRHH